MKKIIVSFLMLLVASISYAYNGTLQLYVSNGANATFTLTSPDLGTFTSGGVYTIENHNFVGGALIEGNITVPADCELTIYYPRLGTEYYSQALNAGDNNVTVFIPTGKESVQIYIIVKKKE